MVHILTSSSYLIKFFNNKFIATWTDQNGHFKEMKYRTEMKRNRKDPKWQNSIDICSFDHQSTIYIGESLFSFVIHDWSGRTRHNDPNHSYHDSIPLHIAHSNKTKQEKKKKKKTIIPTHHSRPIKSIKSRTFNHLCSSIIRTNSVKHTNPSPSSSTSLIIRRQSSNVHLSSPIDL